MTINILSQKIKFARHQKGLNQKQVSEKLNVSRTTITNYETGYARPTPEQIDKLCEILEVNKDWLLKTNDNFYYDLDEKQIEDKTHTEFGNKLRLLRNSLGMTLEDVSKEIGMSISGYAKYETGKGEPSLDTLREIALLYNVSVDNLLGLESNNKKPIEESIEELIIEISTARDSKKNAIKNIWKEIKNL